MIDAYTHIGQQALKGKRYHETIIVRIRVDGQCINEILEFDGGTASYIWQNDWYEGQKEVEYVGSVLLSEVRIPDETIRP